MLAAIDACVAFRRAVSCPVLIPFAVTPHLKRIFIKSAAEKRLLFSTPSCASFPLQHNCLTLTHLVNNNRQPPLSKMVPARRSSKRLCFSILVPTWGTTPSKWAFMLPSAADTCMLPCHDSGRNKPLILLFTATPSSLMRRARLQPRPSSSMPASPRPSPSSTASLQTSSPISRGISVLPSWTSCS